MKKNLVVFVLVFLAPLALVLGCIAWKPASYSFERIYDDSYYYLLIARHIVQGMGSTFDGVERTNGYHPLWMGLCVAVSAINSDWLTAPLVLITVQAFLAAAGLFILERSWRRYLTPTISICAALVLGAHLLWAYFNLMESGLLFFFLACSAWVLLRPDVCQWLIEKGGIRTGFMFLGACYARLDTTLLVAGFLLGLFVAWLRLYGWRRALIGSLRIGLPILLGLAPYLIYNYVSFGSIVPIHGLAKTRLAFNPEADPSMWNRFWIVFRSTFQEGPRAALNYLSIWIGPLVLVKLLHTAIRRADPTAWLKAGTILGLLLNFTYYACNSVEGMFTWYVLPYSMVSVFLCFRFVAVCLQWLERQALYSARVAVTVLIALATATLFGLRARTEILAAHRSLEFRQIPIVSLLGRLAAQHPAATAAAWNAGLPGYAFEGRLTNLDGLVNNRQYLDDYLSQYRTVDYILENKFDFVIDRDRVFGFIAPRDSHLPGMPADAVRRLLEHYDLGYVDDKFVVLVRKDVADRYFPGTARAVQFSDLKW